MPTDALLVFLLTAVTVSPWIARIAHLPLPTTQFLLGCALAVLPSAGRIVVSPDLILLVVLPMILLWESYQTSVTWARKYWRPILLNGVFLVVATAAGVAVVAHAFGVTWPAAWALGAVIAPTDASAVAAFGRAIPTRYLTVLRAESLINDGTALVVLGVAIEAANHQHFGPASVLLRGVQAYAIGIAVGLGLAAFTLIVVRNLSDPMVHASFALTLPFLAAVPAEALHGSGVVAVVTCGLAGSRGSRRAIPARLRLPNHAFWEVTTFVLNGALFVLTGLQLRPLLTHLSASHGATLLMHGIALTGLVILIRFVWSSTMALVLRTIDRRPVQRTLRAPFRARVMNGWAGMRGGISLAAALTIPRLAAGAPFPDRQDLILLTFVVIGSTLLVQGTTLSRVVRWASSSFPPPPARNAVTAARKEISSRVLRAFDTEWFLRDADANDRETIRREIERNSTRFPSDDPRELALMRLRLAVLERKRHELLELVTQGEIEDSVMWEVQRLLDHDEARIEALLESAE
jgi:CPA1 family monovalent cation:H+ antiporter